MILSAFQGTLFTVVHPINILLSLLNSVLVFIVFTGKHVGRLYVLFKHACNGAPKSHDDYDDDDANDATAMCSLES